MRGAFFGAFAVCAAAGQAWAGAWPLKPGQTQAITGFSLTTANERFDGPAAVLPDAQFRKLEGRLFFERGVTERLTFTGQAAYARSELDDGAAISVGGGGEIEAGLRATLWRGRRTVGALQAVIGGSTGFSGARDPVTGANGVDLEGRALFGLSLDDLLAGGFLDAQGAYRRRFGDAADEVRLDLTTGFAIGPTDWRFFIQSFNSFGVTDAVAPFERARLHKLATSFVSPLAKRTFGDGVQIQLGVERALAGRSAFRETRVFTALWLTF